MVEAVGFEPTCFLGIRFTVWRFQPLTHTSIIVNALFGMRVLKHNIPTDKLLVQGTGKLIPVSLICFNTLWFFTPQKELYPTGRPFVCFLVCSDGTSFPYCTKWKTLEFLVPGSFWGILILVTVYDSSRTLGLLEMYSRDHSRAPRYLPGAWV